MRENVDDKGDGNGGWGEVGSKSGKVMWKDAL